MIRVLLLLTLAAAFHFVKKAKNHTAYDKLMVGSVLITITGGGIINATRPENFLFHSIISIVSVFVLYIVLPMSFRDKSLTASIVTVGEILIILLLSSATGTAAYTLLFSLIVANIIAAMSSLQLRLYRRRTYDEFLKRKETQDALKKHANQLSDLVEERTKDLNLTQSRLLKSERLAAIGELAGMVGHDLRNPLAAIKNSAYYLRKKNEASIDKSGQEMLAIIDRSVEHANSIISELLDYSREIKLDLEQYSLKTMMNYAFLSINLADGIKIIDRLENSPLIWVDANKIQRVFVNLIKNAIDAMPNGGVLEISNRRIGREIELVFRDTGTGIPEEIMSKIFTPLFTTKPQGTGLGLPICKRVVEAHHGKITVESSLNRGTTFTITLPIEQNKDLVGKAVKVSDAASKT